MTVRIKICGICSVEDAQLSVRAGASALGFLCGVPASVPCHISPVEAREIIRTVPPYVSAVLVTTSSDSGQIEKLLEHVPACAVQLHGPISTGDLAELRASNPRLKFIKTIQVAGDAAVSEARLWGGHADALLLDSRGEGDLGGTGRTHDWNVSRQIVQSVNVPVILAGGLSAENVAAAVRATRPFAVDVNSGVAGPPRRKDPAKIAEFVRRVAETAWTE